MEKKIPETRTTLDELTLDPMNRRSHGERNVSMIADSLRAVGAARSIVIDEHGVILVGNGVTAAARAVGLQRVRVVDSDSDELIAVRRRGLSDEQKRALALFDNRTAELAEWNAEQLGVDKGQGLPLQPFWTEAEEAILLGQPVAPSWDGMPDFQQEDQLAWRTVKVHFAKQEDLDAFAALVQQAITQRTRFIWFPAAAREAVVGEREYASDERKP